MTTRELLKINIINILENNKEDMRVEDLDKALGNVFSNDFKEAVLRELREQGKISFYEKPRGGKVLNYYTIPFYKEYENIKKILKQTNNNLNISNRSIEEVTRDFLFNELFEVNILIKKLEKANKDFKETYMNILLIHLNSIKIILSSCIKKSYTNNNDVLREILDKESPLNTFVIKDNKDYTIIKKLSQDDFFIKYIDYLSSLKNRDKTLIRNKGISKIKSILRKINKLDNSNNS